MSGRSVGADPILSWGEHNLNDEARRLTRLIVGPWSHGAPRSTVGELDFGMRASPFLLDMKEDITRLHRRWFDARLRGKTGEIDEEPPVKIFVMGVNRWRHEEEWPPARFRAERWHIHGAGGLAPEPPPESEPSVFSLDPDDPVRTSVVRSTRREPRPTRTCGCSRRHRSPRPLRLRAG